MNKFVLNLLVCWIPFKKVRKELRRKIKNYIYGKEVLRNAKSIGDHLNTNGAEKITSKIRLVLNHTY